MSLHLRRVADAPSGPIIRASGHLWAPLGDAVAEIDPRTDAVAKRIAIGAGPMFGGFVRDGSLLAEDVGHIVVIDPRTAAVVSRHGVPGVRDGRWSWQVSGDLGTLLRRDARTGAVTGRVDIGPADPTNWRPIVAVGDGFVWIGRGQHSDVISVNEKTLRRNEVLQLPSHDSLVTVGYGFNRLWVEQTPNPGDSIVRSIDPSTGAVLSTTHVGSANIHPTQYGGVNFVFDHGDVWTGDSSQTVSTLDGRTGRLLRIYRLVPPRADLPWCCGPGFLAISDGKLWVSFDQDSDPADIEVAPLPGG